MLLLTNRNLNDSFYDPRGSIWLNLEPNLANKVSLYQTAEIENINQPSGRTAGNVKKLLFSLQCNQKKLPNVYKRCPKMISLKNERS